MHWAQVIRFYVTRLNDGRERNHNLEFHKPVSAWLDFKHKLADKVHAMQRRLYVCVFYGPSDVCGKVFPLVCFKCAVHRTTYGEESDSLNVFML